MLYHVDSSHIRTELNHVNLNHVNLDQLISVYLTTIDDSDDVCASNQLFLWDMGFTGAATNTVFKRTQLFYVPSMHTSHKPYMVN